MSFVPNHGNYEGILVRWDVAKKMIWVTTIPIVAWEMCGEGASHARPITPCNCGGRGIARGARITLTNVEHGVIRDDGLFFSSASEAVAELIGITYTEAVDWSVRGRQDLTGPQQPRLVGKTILV